MLTPTENSYTPVSLPSGNISSVSYSPPISSCSLTNEECPPPSISYSTPYNAYLPLSVSYSTPYNAYLPQSNHCSPPYNAGHPSPCSAYRPPYQSPTDNFNLASSSFSPQETPQRPSFQVVPPSNPVFTLQWLSGKVRKCYGCAGDIRADTSTIPNPPYDLVVRFKERRYYRDSSTQSLKLTRNEENTYYHPMPRCIQMKHPSFNARMLDIPAELECDLMAIHKLHICDNFGIYL